MRGIKTLMQIKLQPEGPIPGRKLVRNVTRKGPPGTVLEDCLRVRQSGAIRVLVALVRMIQDLWARASTMWLLGEFGVLLFCSPEFWDVGGLLRALSSPGG